MDNMSIDNNNNNNNNNNNTDGENKAEYQKAKGKAAAVLLRYHTPSPDDALVWLLHCSPLMRDLAESPLDDAEHEGNSSLTERAARVFPKWSVCAERDLDWRLVAKVIHEWSVDPAPFWFYDLVVRAHGQHWSTATDGLQKQVIQTEETPILHQFWRSLLALSQNRGNAASGERLENRFWSCLRAYTYSKNTRFLEYWTAHLALIPVPQDNRLIGFNIETFPKQSFSELVVDTRDMVALDAVLQQVLQWDKVRDWECSAQLFECLFASDWAEAWETTAQFFFAHANLLKFHHVPVASHPAAIPWAHAFLQKAGTSNRYAFGRFDWRSLWCSNCILEMAAVGRLEGLRDVEELPPSFRSVNVLLKCLEECTQTASIAPLVLRLRQVIDEVVVATTPSTPSYNKYSSVERTCWRLVTNDDDYTRGGPDMGRRWVILEELSRNGLFRLPAVDSDAGAVAFGELFAGLFWTIERNSGLAQPRMWIEREWASLKDGGKKDDWKPLGGVHLRARMLKLNAFGWGTDKLELRAMLGRLAEGVMSGFGGTYKMYCGVDEFMELLDADSESACRVKTLKKCA